MQVRSSTTQKTRSPARLKARKDFLRIQRGGARFRGDFVVFMTRPAFNKNAAGRYGLVAPKAIGKAHDRNFVKRRLRHIISLHPDILINRDVVLLASAAAAGASFSDLKEDVLKGSKRVVVRAQASGGNDRRGSLNQSKVGRADVR